MARRASPTVLRRHPSPTIAASPWCPRTSPSLRTSSAATVRRTSSAPSPREWTERRCRLSRKPSPSSSDGKSCISSSRWAKEPRRWRSTVDLSRSMTELSLALASSVGNAPLWRREPYRLLFPLGIVLSWTGVLPWLFDGPGAGIPRLLRGRVPLHHDSAKNGNGGAFAVADGCCDRRAHRHHCLRLARAMGTGASLLAVAPRLDSGLRAPPVSSRRHP